MTTPNPTTPTVPTPADFAALFDPSKLMDQMSKMLGSYNLPGMDPSVAMTIYKNRVDALTKANQAAIEGFQTLLQRESDMLQQMMQEAVQALRSMGQTGTSPSDAIAAQADFVRSSLQTAVTNMRELSDMATKAYRDAMDHVHKQTVEDLTEIRAAAKRAASAT